MHPGLGKRGIERNDLGRLASRAAPIVLGAGEKVVEDPRGDKEQQEEHEDKRRIRRIMEGHCDRAAARAVAAIVFHWLLHCSVPNAASGLSVCLGLISQKSALSKSG